MNLQISEGLIFASCAKCHRIQYIMNAGPTTTASTALFLIIMEIFGKGLFTAQCTVHAKVKSLIKGSQAGGQNCQLIMQELAA